MTPEHERLHDGVGSSEHLTLSLGVLDVEFHALFGNAQDLRDFPCRLAVSDPFENFHAHAATAESSGVMIRRPGPFRAVCLSPSCGNASP
jgi:hypothetical protein